MDPAPAPQAAAGVTPAVSPAVPSAAVAAGGTAPAASSPGWVPFAVRWRGLLAGIWLVYLVQPLRQATELTPWWRAALGVAVLVGFGVFYLWVFLRVRRDQLTGYRPEPAKQALCLGLGVVLFVLGTVVVGENALAMTMYLMVITVLGLPTRLAVPAVGVLVGTVLVLPRVVPSWHTVDDLALTMALIAFAVWGLFQMIARTHDLALAQARLAELAVVAERERFSRDLHDILGHSLTVVAIKAELAGRLVQLDPERAAAEIGDLERLARQALADVRTAVRGYREISLAGELTVARAALDAAGVVAELPEPVELPREREELFAWVVREGVTNVVRHSRARRCRIRLGPDRIEVEDDGVGAARVRLAGPVQPAPAGVGGHGLAGLRERAEAVGARLDLDRSELGGAALRATW